MVSIEIIYYLNTQDFIHLCISLPEAATVRKALELSGLLQLYPTIETHPLGIFSKRVTLDTYLKEGDRIEIYNPLLLDPKEKRRIHAKRTKK